MWRSARASATGKAALPLRLISTIAPSRSVRVITSSASGIRLPTIRIERRRDDHNDGVLFPETGETGSSGDRTAHRPYLLRTDRGARQSAEPGSPPRRRVFQLTFRAMNPE